MIQIPQNTTIIGELKCEGNIEVKGRIDGDSDIKGLLIIARDCVWTGKAVADSIIVEGIVEGSIIARKKLEIAPSARITGSITAPYVLIAKSATLDCEMHMERNKQAIDLLSHREQRRLVIPKLRLKNKASNVKEKNHTPTLITHSAGQK